MKITLKNVCSRIKTVLRENYVNREGKRQFSYSDVMNMNIPAVITPPSIYYFEWGTIVVPHLGHHDESVPVATEKAYHPRSMPYVTRILKQHYRSSTQ